MNRLKPLDDAFGQMIYAIYGGSASALDEKRPYYLAIIKKDS
jgi:hypothetical protein